MKKLTSNYIRSLLLKRKKESHKGDYGHVLILAGSKGMTGAAILSAYGALRCGAGLVTVGIPESQQKILASRIRPEAMTLGLPEKDGKFSFKALSKISEFIRLRKVTSIVIGPGIGKSPDTAHLVKSLLLLSELSIVLDADGLNVIPSKSSILKNSKAMIIATPHPGELSRLIGIPARKINQNRINAATEFSKINKLVCVLKGHKTVVSNGSQTFLNTTGNPGMATGGSGDVLSGMISALISQVKEPKLINAALCGVFLHGLAGDLASKFKTQIGLIAQDIADNIAVVMKKVIK